MILQEKRILCTVEEPDKNHLWLRPRLTREGFDLLYFGANGWTPLIDWGCYNDSLIDDCPMTMIPGTSNSDTCDCDNN